MTDDRNFGSMDDHAMRSLLLPACLVTLCLTAGSRASAEDVQACDILCRVTGYLTADHMAAGPADAETPHAGPAKPHRSRLATAARKTTASTPADKTAATPSKPAATAASMALALPSKAIGSTSVARKPAVAKLASARPKAGTLASTRPARPRPSLVAAEPRRDAEKPVAELRRPVAPAPRSARAAATRHSAKSTRMAALPLAPARTQTAAALIPGSVPTMPAGFQPLGTSSFH